MIHFVLRHGQQYFSHTRDGTFLSQIVVLRHSRRYFSHICDGTLYIDVQANHKSSLLYDHELQINHVLIGDDKKSLTLRKNLLSRELDQDYSIPFKHHYISLDTNTALTII